MAIPTLPKIQIPQAIPNAYGESVRVGHFDILKVVVPPITYTPPFGYNTVTVLIDGKPVQETLLEPGDSDLILLDIPPFALKCCWQTIGYTVAHVHGTDISETLLLLNEGT